MIRLVTFGLIVDDLVLPDGQTQMGVLGGGGPQTAWGMAAALGGGSEVGLAAGVGVDLDPGVLAPLRAAGVNLDGLRVSDLPTPRAWQVTEADGRRTQVWRSPLETLGAQLAREWDVLPQPYRAARAFHWGIHPGEAESYALAGDLRARGRRVSLEPFRPPLRPLPDDALRALLAACDVFSPSEREGAALVGAGDPREQVERFRALGGRILALRRGAAGAEVWDLAAGRGVRVPAISVRAVDPVGAGNAFCGALLARLDDGLGAAACHASAAASYLVEQVGLPAALPDPAEYAARVARARAGLEACAL